MNKPIDAMKVRGNVHPLADMVPRLQGQEFLDLVESIKTHGLMEPIVLDKDHKLIDGINRLEACIHAKIEPIFTIYEGDNIASFIVARNVVRRHLTASQRASFAARLQKIAASEDPNVEFTPTEVAKIGHVDRKTARKAIELVEKAEQDEQARKKLAAVEAGLDSVFSDDEEEDEPRGNIPAKAAASDDSMQKVIDELMRANDLLVAENEKLREMVDEDIEKKIASYEETIERQAKMITDLQARVSALTKENKKLKEALDQFA